MSKFIGQMSYEEFIDAIKIILQKDEKEQEDSKTFKEKCSEGLKETIDFFKYIITFAYIKDCWISVIEFFKRIKSAFSPQKKENLKQKTEEIIEQDENLPLTKEVFIKKGKQFKASLFETIDTVVFVLVMVIIIRFFIGEIRWIPSGSMHPTLLEGDRIFVERYSRFYKTPERGDIMVFYPPFENLKNTPMKLFSRLTGFFCKDIAYIKRVVGLPGEKFEIKEDETGKFTVYINDKPLDEPYIQSAYEYTTCTEKMVCGPVIIPEGQYLMLGDNRGNSQDSRYWGFLPKERFIGKATYLFWPIKRIKSLKLKKN